MSTSDHPSSPGVNRPGSSKKALPELPDGVRRGLAGIVPPQQLEPDPEAERAPVQPLPWSLADETGVSGKSSGGRSGQGRSGQARGGKARRPKGGRAGAVTGRSAGIGAIDAFEGPADGMPEWAASDPVDAPGGSVGPSASDVVAGESGDAASGVAARSSSGGQSSGAGGRRRSGLRGSRRFGDRRPSASADSELDESADPSSAARTILLDKLSGQPRTRAELADLLAERDIPDEVADEVLDRFTDVGLIDDAAFANAWVESRHRGRGLGKRALAQELRRRGVDDELARDALEELDPDQEEATARALVRKKLRSMRSLDRQVAMRRLIGMLARKGYPGSLAMTVVKQELAATDEELPLLNDSGLEAE